MPTQDEYEQDSGEYAAEWAGAAKEPEIEAEQAPAPVETHEPKPVEAAVDAPALAEPASDDPQAIAKARIAERDREYAAQWKEDTNPTEPMSFKEAFAQARKDGLKTFQFKGKSYTTDLKKPDAKAAVVTKTEPVAVAVKTEDPKPEKGFYADANKELIDGVKGVAAKFTDSTPMGASKPLHIADKDKDGSDFAKHAFGKKATQVAGR